MKKIGTIKEIWRYPVKGMSGESVESCFLDEKGLQGDRLFAVRDTVRQEIQSCKFRPGLLNCIATYSEPEEVLSNLNFSVLFPDGQQVSSDSDEMNQKISQLLGHDSTIESIRPIQEADFYRRYKKDEHTWLEELKATFAREPGEPLPDFSDLEQDFVDYVTQLGSFFLVSPFHIVTTSSIEFLKTLTPDADWDMRRFRPNIVIEPVEGYSGLVEQAWVNQSISIGNASIECSSPAPRCGAVTRELQGIKADKSMLRTIIKHAEQNLGIYGDITGSNSLRVGDVVYLKK